MSYYKSIVVKTVVAETDGGSRAYSIRFLDEWDEIRQTADPLGFFLHEWERYFAGEIAFDQLPRRFPGARLVNRTERIPPPAQPEMPPVEATLPRAVARYRR